MGDDQREAFGWIVLDFEAGRWWPLYNTYRRTRLESQASYTESGAAGAEGGYRTMRQAGYVRCVRFWSHYREPQESTS